MKLAPQDTENKAKLHLDAMSQMTALLSEKDDIIEQKTDVIAEQKKRIAMLEEYLRLANSKRFGASSEQTPPQQGHLFNEVEAVAEPEPEPVDSPLPTGNEPKAKTGRKPLSDKLPRLQVFAYLSDEEKVGAIDTFFVKVREELDIIPAQVRVLKEPERSPTSHKWMWVTLGGLPQQQSVLFEYDPSRGREVPLRLLDGFTHGYLQTDGCASYFICLRE
jgi:transposase